MGHHRPFNSATLQDEVLDAARRAKEAGSTRFCMGTAWRGVGQKNSFQHILTMVKVQGQSRVAEWGTWVDLCIDQFEGISICQLTPQDVHVLIARCSGKTIGRPSKK